MKNAIKSNRIGAYNKEHKMLISAMGGLWSALLMSNHEHILEDLSIQQFLEHLIEEWIFDTNSIPIQISVHDISNNWLLLSLHNTASSDATTNNKQIRMLSENRKEDDDDNNGYNTASASTGVVRISSKAVTEFPPRVTAASQHHIQSVSHVLWKESAPITKPFPFNRIPTTRDMERVLQRIDTLITAIKTSFMRYSSHSERHSKTVSISNKQKKSSKNGSNESTTQQFIDVIAVVHITDLLMDLGVQGDHLAAGTSLLLEENEKETDMVDFGSFLWLYARCCGLAVPRTYAESIWTPFANGLWHEVSFETCDELRAVAEPYFSFYDKGGDENDVWIARDDIPEILLVAGVREASEASVAEAVRIFRMFLPGADCGKFSLQELITLFNYFVNTSDNNDSKHNNNNNTTTTTMMKSTTTNRSRQAQVPLPYNKAEIQEKRLLLSKSTSNIHSATSTNPHISSPTRDYMSSTSTSTKINKQNELSMLRSGQKLWTLPAKSSVPKSKQAILEEFRKLDFANDGKLTFLSMKCAMEMNDLIGYISDADIRQWIRQYDRGNKGYLDLNDFQNIYLFIDDYDNHRNNIYTLNNNNNNNGTVDMNNVQTTDINNKRDILRKAFERYDVDGDGLISVTDLQTAFASQGRRTSISELQSWVERRDTSGRGAVCFSDFVQHYE
eukprot:gene830-1612_t